jgi:hypothetical protein
VFGLRESGIRTENHGSATLAETPEVIVSSWGRGIAQGANGEQANPSSFKIIMALVKV